MVDQVTDNVKLGFVEPARCPTSSAIEKVVNSGFQLALMNGGKHVSFSRQDQRMCTYEIFLQICNHGLPYQWHHTTQ